MNYKILVLLCLLWGTATALSSAQTKVEREQSIKIDEVPDVAQQFVSDLGATRKVRWYRETSNEGVTIEAKTKLNGHYYSIEFTEGGVLEDVEVVVGWNEMGTILRDAICNQMSNEFSSFKISKIQKQYKGKDVDIRQQIAKNKPVGTVEIKYEVVVRGANEGDYSNYEFLFDSSGNLLRKAKIATPNTDNLEY